VDNDVHIWDEWAYAKYKKEVMQHPDGNCMCHGFTKETVPTMEQFIGRIKNEVGFAERWGNLGEGTYGGMWRAFPYYGEEADEDQYGFNGAKIGVRGTVDQLKKVLDKLKSNPLDRRMIVSAWHPYWVDHCALPPCHCLFHFNTQELTWQERIEIGEERDPKANLLRLGDDDLDKLSIPRRRLNLLLYQRSCDTFLGVPFNITSYALLLAMVAHVSGMVPGTFTHTYGDLHIYKNHQDQVKLQMARKPKLLPKLWLNPEVKNLFDFKYDDIKLIGYEPHPAIKADVAV
jgi:thymidylate synthase